MANTKSALKRAGQNAKRRVRNQHYKSYVRNRVRAVRDAVAAGDAEAANQKLVEAMSALHKVAGKGILHTRAADRRIARLAQAVKKLSGSAAQA